MLSIHLGEAADHVDLFQGKLNRVQLCRAAWNVGGPKLEKKKKKQAEQSLEMAFNESIPAYSVPNKLCFFDTINWIFRFKKHGSL